VTLGFLLAADKLTRGAGPHGVALLMRHGETAWNRRGRVMGKSAVALDSSGRAQVEKALPFARMLKPALVISSPLVRAHQSAEIVAGAVGGVPVVDEPDLEEVHYGRWEGMAFEELADDPDYLRYCEHPATAPTPGGETMEQVQRRAVRAVRRAIEANPGNRILFVSHGDVIRSALCHFIGLAVEHFRRIRVDNATFSAIQLAGDFAEVKFVNLIPDPGRVFMPPPWAAPHERG
jgi:broad specificity phosphatase PhoE